MAVDRFGEVGQRVRGVEDSARLLKRLYLVERETMRALGAWHLSIADWDLKIGGPARLVAGLAARQYPARSRAGTALPEAGRR